MPTIAVLGTFDTKGAEHTFVAEVIRARGPLLRREGDRLILQLLDMARIGLLYGLLLDGFKLL